VPYVKDTEDALRLSTVTNAIVAGGKASQALPEFSPAPASARIPGNERKPACERTHQSFSRFNAFVSGNICPDGVEVPNGAVGDANLHPRVPVFSRSAIPEPAFVNILGKSVDVAGVVLNILAPIDFRFGAFNPHPSLVSMRVFLVFFFNEAPYSLSDKRVRAVVVAALNPLPEPVSPLPGSK